MSAYRSCICSYESSLSSNRCPLSSNCGSQRVSDDLDLGQCSQLVGSGGDPNGRNEGIDGCDTGIQSGD
jgi:hypothetical protein